MSAKSLSLHTTGEPDDTGLAAVRKTPVLALAWAPLRATDAASSERVGDLDVAVGFDQPFLVNSSRAVLKCAFSSPASIRPYPLSGHTLS